MPRILLLFFFLYNTALAQVNMNLGLKAYYPFSGNANDVSGNNNNPAFNNATLTADRFGNANSAYLFNGTSNYMRIPNSPSINATTQLSICAWVKVNGFYQGPCHGNSIMMKGDADFLPGNYALRFDDGGYTNNQNCSTPVPDIAHENFYGANAAVPASGYNPFIQTGQWYSVVYTCDGITSKIYVNCELKISAPAAGITFTNGYDLFLGKLNAASFPYWFNGVMDEVRLYNRALNVDEVKSYGDCARPAGTNVGGIINTYTPVVSLDDVCKNSLIVEDASTFNTGDTVLLIQMKGAAIDSTNTAAFGTITNYKNSGNYEFNYVKSKTGNSIVLKNKLTRSYDIPAGKVQLVRVPYFNNAIVSSPLSCLPWDGSKGGILVLNASDTVYLSANIDVSGKGFRGGNDPVSNPPTFDCYENQFFYPANPDVASEKGEGIAIISAAKSFGKGALANGGGGGNSHNSGGGGGGNGATAGFGGYNFEGSPCDGTVPFDNRGFGGKILTYSTAANKVFMGGGGGGGHSNNPEAFQAKGGNGAGMIFIIADKLQTNGFKIMANGNPGVPCGNTGSGCHEGMGGGGSGGTTLMNINNYLDNAQIEAKGGQGADMTAAGFGRVGPGGGGGGGVLWVTNPAVPATITPTVTGGAGGVCTGYANSPWGTTSGLAGITLTDLSIPFDNALFTPNIDSVRFKDSATACASYDFKGFAYTNTTGIASWQWYFGDGNTANTQNTSHTYLTQGTFTVKLVVTDLNGCKDSLSRDVSTIVLDFDFNYQTNICSPLTVQFHGLGSTVQNPFWSFGDAVTISGNLNPIHTYSTPGMYVVKYSVGNGTCTDTVTKTINLSVLQDDIILTHDTTICAGSAKQLLTVPSLGFCWSPTTYLNNPNIPNPTSTPLQTITYYFTAEIPGANIITNGNFNAGNTGFTSQYTYANPNITEGQYFVGTNPQAWNASTSPCPDHTTGTGNMMLVNGSPTANVKVWNQTVPVTPNTNYAFSTWIQSIYNVNPAQLQFSINGHDLGSPITASLPTCTWRQFYTTWNSGNNTSAAISIVNKNTIVQGNDFALDDISFAPVLTKIDSVKITIETPLVTATTNAQVCPGIPVQLNATGAASYSWSPAAGLNNANIANPVATPAVTTQYIVTGTTTNGCIAKDTIDITIKPKPIITKSNNATICSGASTQLTAGGGVFYSWTPTASLDNSISATPIATPTSTTMYYVTVTGGNTCTNIDSILVTIRPDPVFTVGGPQNDCETKSVQLNATGGHTYSWQPAGSLSNPALPNPFATPLTTTNYLVHITDTVCHISADLSTTVTVFPLPAIKASKSNDLDCSNDQSQLLASGGALYEWYPAATLNNAFIANPIAKPYSVTKYVVKGTDGFGCENYDSVTVDITSANVGIYLMPTAFTPNGDGLNDCFGVKYWGVIKELDFSIYDRWGTRLFRTKQAGECWDGTFKGKKQDPGIYVFMITAKTECQNAVFRKGTFALIR